MREAIHPQHVVTEVRCTCGNTFQVYSHHATLTVDICSACHPFYTGTQKFVDTAGRVDAFTKRFQWKDEDASKQAEKKVSKITRHVTKDLKTELEKRKVFGKKKPIPVPEEKSGGPRQ